MMLRHSIKTPKVCLEVAAAKNSAPLTLYQNVRSNHSKYHQHITFSRIADRKPRQPIVDPSFFKVGEHVSPSVIFGDMAHARRTLDMESLNSRGFLRYQKPYTPPANAAAKVLQLCRACMNSASNDESFTETKLTDSRMKYDLLTKISAEFNHSVPNSMLHMINTVGDVVEFYCTIVNTQTPYEELIRNPDLPPNLHIQKDPVRFHPDTDTKFRGESAFPKNSVIVTGLRAKKKYRGFEAKMVWP